MPAPRRRSASAARSARRPPRPRPRSSFAPAAFWVLARVQRRRRPNGPHEGPSSCASRSLGLRRGFLRCAPAAFWVLARVQRRRRSNGPHEGPSSCESRSLGLRRDFLRERPRRLSGQRAGKASSIQRMREEGPSSTTLTTSKRVGTRSQSPSRSSHAVAPRTSRACFRGFTVSAGSPRRALARERTSTKTTGQPARRGSRTIRSSSTPAISTFRATTRSPARRRNHATRASTARPLSRVLRCATQAPSAVRPQVCGATRCTTGEKPPHPPRLSKSRGLGPFERRRPRTLVRAQQPAWAEEGKKPRRRPRLLESDGLGPRGGRLSPRASGPLRGPERLRGQ